MGLVGWGEWFEAGQDFEHPFIDHDRLGVDRPAMHHAMTDRHHLQARTVGLEPGEDSEYGVFLRRDLGQGSAIGDASRRPCR